ncbi:MAG: glycosyltransferase [Candidatus Sericytochromatia bacterium]
MPNILIGPLWNTIHLGAYDRHPRIQAFGMGEAALRSFLPKGLGQEYYSFPEHFIALDFGRSGQLRLADIFAGLPAGWQPEVLIWMGFYFGLPVDLESCPVPSILVVSDWHVHYSLIREVVDAFDYVLCDKALLATLQARGYSNCAYWPAYSFAPEIVGESPQARDLDVVFIGNFSPAIYAERNRYLLRLARLGQDYRVLLASQIYHPEYSKVLSRSKIVFNHSIRREMNLRAYEAAACGALCLVEADNLEVRDFLVPGESCVLYDRENFEDVVRHYLAHPEQARAIARAGQERIQAFDTTGQFQQLLEALPGILASIGQQAPGRPFRRTPPLRRQLLRVLHLSTTDMPELRAQAILLLEELLQGPLSGHERLQVLNALAVCQTDYRASLAAGYTPDLAFSTSCAQAQQLLQQAVAGMEYPDPVLLHNLLWIHALNRGETPTPAAGLLQLLEQQKQALKRLDQHSIEDFGLFVLPLGYTQFYMQWQRQQQIHENAPGERLEVLRRLLTWSGLFHYGQLAAAAGSADLAQAAFAAARESWPDFSDTDFELAKVQLWQRQPRQAIASLQAGIDKGVFYPQAWISLISLQLSLNQLEQAREALQTARVLFQAARFESLRPRLQQLEMMLHQADPQTQLEGFLGE